MADIIFTGNLGADAELRTTQSGRSVLNFRIGDSKSKKNGEQWETVAQNWFNVAIWGELAEFYAGKLTKGTRVTVTGEFYQREYDKNDGSGKGISLDVVAWGLRIIPKRDNSGGGFQQPAQQPAPQQGGNWNAPAADPWSSGGQQNNGGWGNPSDKPAF